MRITGPKLLHRIIHSTVFGFISALLTSSVFLNGCVPARQQSGVTGAPVVFDSMFPHPGSLPAPGTHHAEALTPSILRIRAAASRDSWDNPPSHWAELEDAENQFAKEEPEPARFEVTLNGRTVPILEIGLRREPVFAGYHSFDLLLMNALFLRIDGEMREGDLIRIRDRQGSLWPEALSFAFHEHRFSPAIHINHAGYHPDFPKHVMVSGDLGSLGELPIPTESGAQLLNEKGEVVFEAPLVHQTEEGWRWHQQVWRFDFSQVKQPGLYRVHVPGLGKSAPLRIHDGAFAAAARLHALGMFHQRSGFEKRLPFTRIEHAASHMRPAEIPTTGPEFREANRNLARMVRNNLPRPDDALPHPAPPLLSFDDSLFPFVNQGTVDVSGGHFDAGDYSKYMTNSSFLVAALMFAVDTFPGVSGIDNLGLPESGDGIPDALQIAKWEADFILKMQDADGGFYFLVYPRNRSYELDVLPENGDPQVVFPKTMVSTAAAVGALAQSAASPHMRRHFPGDAARYLAAAEKGYAFLRRAIAEHGLEGSFQVISHYGRDHGALDELCHAAAAMFAATGDKSYEEDLMSWWPDPLDGTAMRWGWVPLTASFGSAARVYAFVEQNGILPQGSADPDYLARMRQAVAEAAEPLLRLARVNAFGIPLSTAGKRNARVGWYWAMEFAFDLAAAMQAEPDPERRNEILGTILDCFGFEFGVNPPNRAFVSGGGPVWRRQVVNRITLNDNRTLAVSGIAAGNVVSSPHNLRPYMIDGASGLRRMYHPTLDAFPFYDRAALDAYNVRAEFVTATTAKILSTYLMLMAQSGEAQRPWGFVRAEITGAPAEPRPGEVFSAGLRLEGDLDLNGAVVIWEVPGAGPQSGTEFRGAVFGEGPVRLEVEIVWPDGRRAFAVHPMTLQP